MNLARLIEFQGKAKATGKWITGSLHFGNDLCNHLGPQYCDCVFIDRKEENDKLSRYLVIPETIGQYTNVIGSDGKKIYDHNIVSNGINRGEVYWNYTHNGWRVAAEGKDNHLFDTKLDGTYRSVGHKYEELVQSNCCLSWPFSQ